MAGYSPTPLVRKLGLKPGVPAAVIGAPMDYGTLLAIGAAPAALAADAPIPPGLAYLHLFTVHRAEMEQVLIAARGRIASDGMIWISWPKKVSKLPTDITEDVIRDVCLPMGYVDIKVCAVTDIWSGLKLVIRKELR